MLNLVVLPGFDHVVMNLLLREFEVFVLGGGKFRFLPFWLGSPGGCLEAMLFMGEYGTLVSDRLCPDPSFATLCLWEKNYLKCLSSTISSF